VIRSFGAGELVERPGSRWNLVGETQLRLGGVDGVLVVEGASSLGSLAKLKRSQVERILVPGGKPELAQGRGTVRQGASGGGIVRLVEAQNAEAGWSEVTLRDEGDGAAPTGVRQERFRR
jgi:hypothetical protein